MSMNILKIVKKIAFCLPLFSYAFDLNMAYKSALGYNADYLAQISRTAAGQESQVQGIANLLPKLTASGTYAANYLAAAGTSTYYMQPVASVQLSQIAFDFSRFSQYTRSKYATQMSNLQLENAKQKLIIDVARAYFDVLYAIDTLKTIQLSKDAFSRQLERAKKSFEAGTVTITDVNDAQSSYDSAVAQEIQAQNDLMNRKNILRNLTGLDPEEIQPLIKDIDLILPSPKKIEDWAKLAKDNNVNLKISNKQLAMAKEDISIAKAGHMPTLNVIGSYLYQGSGSIIGGTDTLEDDLDNIPGTPISDFTLGSLGLQLALPIYSGGMVNSQIRQARATYHQSQQQLVALERQTDQDIKNAFWQVYNGVSIVKAQTQALKSSETKLKSDSLGYQVGIRNSIDLVNSQKNYAQSLQNYNNSRYQYLQYRLQLRYLSGQIDEKYLEEINRNIKSS